MKLFFRPQAESDLIRIYDHIADDSPVNAANYIDRLEKVCPLLIEQPLMGKPRAELKPEGIYSFPTDNYLIFYLIGNNVLEIVSIIHGSRDYQSDTDYLGNK